MKIHLVKKMTIVEYTWVNRNSQFFFDKWLHKLKLADWNEPSDIRYTFGSVDFLGKTHRVVFNIGGNKYRMICSYKFGENQVHFFIKWIGTLDEYNTLCAKQQQYTIKSF